MLEAHKAKLEARQAEKAAADLAARVASWQAECDGYVHLLELARTYAGESSSQALLLAPGEAAFATVTGASLIEERRGAGHWQGGSAGVSVPIGHVGGRSVRYRVGATRGHYVQGTPSPTAIDKGTVVVTDRRVVFQGSGQTRECPFDKLVGIQHDDAAGSSTFSTSNRARPVTVHYGPALAGWFDFRVDLALAHYRGQVAALVTRLQQELTALQASRPGPGAP